MRLRPTFFISCILTSLLAVAHPITTWACAIDNVASLTANGVPAMLVTDPPTSAGPWAPFVLAQAVAPRTTVRLEEEPADLARTLPAAVRAVPFRWAFGDGAVAIGPLVAHQYVRPGQYHLQVYGYDPRGRRWFVFDGALVRVVPAGQLLGANLEYNLLQTVIALSGITWPLDGVLIGAVLILLLRLSRRAPRSGATGTRRYDQSRLSAISLPRSVPVQSAPPRPPGYPPRE
ncbi:MAG TPA: PKD domain-containing protein [Chloroflexota bacterium]